MGIEERALIYGYFMPIDQDFFLFALENAYINLINFKLETNVSDNYVVCNSKIKKGSIKLWLSM